MNTKERSFKDSFYWMLLARLPKNAMSRAAGILAGLRLPQPFMRFVILGFARRYKINLSEVARPIHEFDSLQSFFIRHLKAGVRKSDASENAFVSPCDGAYGQSGKVENALLIQVKGKSYRLSELLCDDKWAKQLEGASYATLYLSPKDYHRFHAPCDMHILEGAHVPGQLWPVNLWAVANVEELFCVNERVVMKAEAPNKAASPFVIIAVGATMVGKVKLEFDDSLTTNRPNGRYLRRSYTANQAHYKKGDELGRFEFGSTLVVIVPKELGALELKQPGTPVQMGQKIGTF